MRIETLQASRIILRPIRLSDAPWVFAMRSDKEYGKYTDIPQYKDPEEAVRYINRVLKEMESQSCYVWANTSASEGTFLGSICLWNFTEDRLSAEIGYDLLPEYRGKGYMGEAVSLVLDFAFDRLGLASVFANLHGDHTKSLNVLERAGFRKMKAEGEFVLYEIKRTAGQ